MRREGAWQPSASTSSDATLQLLQVYWNHCGLVPEQRTGARKSSPRQPGPTHGDAVPVPRLISPTSSLFHNHPDSCNSDTDWRAPSPDPVLAVPSMARSASLAPAA